MHRYIKDEHELLRQLIETIEHFSSGMAISHVDAGHNIEVKYLSEEYCNIFEDDEDVLIQRLEIDLYAGIHPDDRQKVSEAVDNLVKNLRDYEIDYRFETGKGNLKWINVKTKIVKHDDDTATCYSTYTDLTEIRTLEKQMSELIQTVPCGICLYRWDGQDLYPLIANNQFSEMLGEEAFGYLQKVKGQNYTHVHPEDLAGFKQAAYEGLVKTNVVDYTYRSLNYKTDKYIWVRMRGTRIKQPDGEDFIYVSYYDVTKEMTTHLQLRESEQMLTFAAEHAGLWYWRYDAKNDRAYMDQKHQNEFGVDPIMENYPESWFSMGFVEGRFEGVYRNALERIKNGEKRVVFEARTMFKDKLSHWVKYSFSNIFDDEGNAVIAVCTATVIDEEKETQEKYKMERSRIFAAEDNLLVHAIFNLTTGDTLEYTYKDGTEVGEEDRTTFVYGEKNAELLIDDAERAQFLALNNKDNLLKRFAEGEADIKFEYRRMLPSGEEAWVRSVLHMVRDPRNNDVLLFEYWYNVEEEKMKELMYHSLATDNYDYVARINGKSKRYVIFPKEGETCHMMPLTGNDADNVAMAIYGESVVPEDRKGAIDNSLVANINENLSKNGRHQFTYRQLQPDGSIRNKKVTQYYLDEQRKIIIMTCEDITETIRAETEKNRMLATALEAADQASIAKNQFLSRVSHELRTPLNAIIGSLELAKDADFKQKEEYLQNSDAAAKQLLAIINDVLDMSSIEAGKLKISYTPFDFKHLIHSITNIYVTQCQQKGIVFDTQILTPIDEWLIGDKLRVNQILLNLIGNAVKFTTEGQVCLKISQADSRGEIVNIRFEVCDTGCGMNEEIKGKLFKPFEQESPETAQKYGGNGLGLSIVKSLVSMMNGTIQVESEQNTGSTFTVDIPFIKTDSDMTIASVDSAENLRVLAVDDEATERNYISTVLERLGVRHTCVGDGKSAVAEMQRAEKENDQYNICLIDWKMPGYDGIETTKRIRERYGREVVLIVISAYEHHQANENAKDAGANMFITKPLFQSSLLDLFMTLTGGRIEKEETATFNRDFTGRRVLLAEDNTMNRIVAEGIMKRMGIKVESAADGKIALEKFIESEPGYYDAILMDNQMPVMGGFEATQQIRKSGHPEAKTIQIISLTANAFKEDIAKSLSFGMNDHVAKPIELDVLVSALDKAFFANK